MIVDPSAIAHTARLCHEVNRTLSHAMGDRSLLPWADSTLTQQNSIYQGVKLYIESGFKLTPEQQHAAWMVAKLADGWTFGLTKDEGMKVHPSLRDYADLPPQERVKDAVFQTIVRTIWQDIWVEKGEFTVTPEA